MSRVQRQVSTEAKAKHRNKSTLPGHPARLGNLGTRLNATPPLTLQAKLVVGRSDDPLEREADQVADLVMRVPEPRLQRKADKVAEPMQAKPLVQRRVSSSKPALAEAPPIVHEVLRSPGRSLEPSTRRSMEARFGHDFSRVRVHTDGKAAASAQAVNARAFTVGRDLVFGPGEYAPGSSQGQRLLAHELVHVIQQKGLKTGFFSGFLQREVIEFPPHEIRIGRHERERILRRAGWRQADVIIILRNFRGEPLSGYAVFASFAAPGVATQHHMTNAEGGVVTWSRIWLKPEGAVTIRALSRGTPALAPWGVTSYQLPSRGALRLRAEQQKREIEVTATTSQEAATKAGVSGTAGVDFEVVSLGGGVSAEEERRRGRTVSTRWKVIIPTSTFNVTVER